MVLYMGGMSMATCSPLKWWKWHSDLEERNLYSAWSAMFFLFFSSNKQSILLYSSIWTTTCTCHFIRLFTWGFSPMSRRHQLPAIIEKLKNSWPLWILTYLGVLTFVCFPQRQILFKAPFGWCVTFTYNEPFKYTPVF